MCMAGWVPLPYLPALCISLFLPYGCMLCLLLLGRLDHSFDMCCCCCISHTHGGLFTFTYYPHGWGMPAPACTTSAPLVLTAHLCTHEEMGSDSGTFPLVLPHSPATTRWDLPSLVVCPYLPSYPSSPCLGFPPSGLFPATACMPPSSVLVHYAAGGILLPAFLLTVGSVPIPLPPLPFPFLPSPLPLPCATLLYLQQLVLLAMPSAAYTPSLPSVLPTVVILPPPCPTLAFFPFPTFLDACVFPFLHAHHPYTPSLTCCCPFILMPLPLPQTTVEWVACSPPALLPAFACALPALPLPPNLPGFYFAVCPVCVYYSWDEPLVPLPLPATLPLPCVPPLLPPSPICALPPVSLSARLIRLQCIPGMPCVPPSLPPAQPQLGVPHLPLHDSCLPSGFMPCLYAPPCPLLCPCTIACPHPTHTL